jgi:hypothetical protein
MVFIDKDMMEVKLEVDGTTYYYSSVEHLQRGLEDGTRGFKMIRMANYIVQGGKFIKNRSSGDDLPNTILALGREEINKLFDFMEKHA